MAIIHDNLNYPAPPWSIVLELEQVLLALADGNQRIWITENMREFSSVVLHASSPYCEIV